MHNGSPIISPPQYDSAVAVRVALNWAPTMPEEDVQISQTRKRTAIGHIAVRETFSIMETQLKAIRTSQSIIVLRGSREALNWCPIMPRNASLSDRKREIFPSFPCAAGQSVDTSAGGCDMQSRGANYETIPSTSIREAGASRHHLPPIKALHVTPNCTSY